MREAWVLMVYISIYIYVLIFIYIYVYVSMYIYSQYLYIYAICLILKGMWKEPRSSKSLAFPSWGGPDGWDSTGFSPPCVFYGVFFWAKKTTGFLWNEFGIKKKCSRIFVEYFGDGLFVICLQQTLKTKHAFIVLTKDWHVTCNWV